MFYFDVYYTQKTGSLCLGLFLHEHNVDDPLDLKVPLTVLARFLDVRATGLSVVIQKLLADLLGLSVEDVYNENILFCLPSSFFFTCFSSPSGTGFDTCDSQSP